MTTMTKADIMRRLHTMVDQLENFPEEWLKEGIYPLHKVTLEHRDDRQNRITLVIGIEVSED